MPVTKIICEDCKRLFEHYTTMRVVSGERGRKKFCDDCIDDHKRTTARNYGRKKSPVMMKGQA